MINLNKIKSLKNYVQFKARLKLVDMMSHRDLKWVS